MLVGLWNWCRRFRRNVSARNVDPHVLACARMPVSTGEDDSSKRVDESSSPVETCRRRRFQNNFLHTICVVDVDVAVEIHIECFCISLQVFDKVCCLVFEYIIWICNQYLPIGTSYRAAVHNRVTNYGVTFKNFDLKSCWNVSIWNLENLENRHFLHEIND